MDNIHWLGHASIKITGSKVIYVDPWKIKGEPADLILITHSHYDHCSADDIKKVTKESTVIVATADSNLEAAKVVKPGDTLDIDGVKIEAVPAYNLGKPFHPKSNNWVGYVITVDGKRIYVAGDTDKIPEMHDLKEIDVALLPIGGTYTMNAEEAAEAAQMFNPKVVVPIHWGDIVGSAGDVEKLKQQINNVIVLNEEK